jgi:hypothetical protein
MEYADDKVDANKLRAIQAANQTELNIPSAAVDYNALNCTNSSPVDFLYLSTIRGGRKMNGGGCGCGMTSGGGSGSGSSVSSSEVRSISGGCFTCKRGVANITHIYSSIHIIIPTLYKKYKTAKAAKAMNRAKPKAAKAAKAMNRAKAAKAAKAMNRAKAAKAAKRKI